MTRTFRHAMVLVALATSATLLVACSTTTTADPTPTVTQDADVNVVTPILSDPDTVAGTTVALHVGDFFDVEVPESGVDKWQATLSADKVVQFFAGEVVDGVVTPPEFAAIGEGTTEVTLTNGTRTVTFTITVTLP